MNYSELAPPYIRAIAPYQPGKPIAELERELGISGIVKLASNENPLGASPRAVAAMHQAIKDIARYPDGNGFELKSALSQRYEINTANIVLGNGSNDLLELAARAFLAPGDKALYAAHAFAVYALATQAVGATGISVPATRDFGHDLPAMLQAAVQHKVKMVFIANPNNPTGTFLSAAELLEFMHALPSNILVVLDEAYNEYLPENLRYDAVCWLRKGNGEAVGNPVAPTSQGLRKGNGEAVGNPVAPTSQGLHAFPNLIISRTFSKAYGLAGLRVGYALMHSEVADMLNRVRQPFNVNSVAQAAAVAALDDLDFVRETREMNQRGMAQVTQGLSKLGLQFIPSLGNFVCFKIAHAQNKLNASQAYRQLLKLGVIVRPVENYDMPDYLRVSIGLESENEKFLSALAQVLGEAV